MTSVDQRIQDRNIETAAGWPTSHQMVCDLLAALGLPVVARPDPPQQVWEQALARVRAFAEHRDMLRPVIRRRTCSRCHQRRHCFLVLWRDTLRTNWLCCEQCVSGVPFSPHVSMVFVEDEDL